MNRICNLFLCLAVPLCSLAAMAEDVVATIPAGTGPRAVAANPRTNLIYVVDSGQAAGPVSVIDGNTGQITASVDVGVVPVAVGINATTNRIYVANQFGESVSVIDGDTNQLETTISGFVGGPTGIAIDTHRNLVYVQISEGPGSVKVLDGQTNQIVATIAFSGAAPCNPTGIAIDQNRDRVYVACPAPNLAQLIVLDGKTRTASVVDVGPIGSGGPGAVAVNPKTNLIYLTLQGPQGCDGNGLFFCQILRVVDGRTLTVLDSFEVGPLNGNFQAIAVNPRADRVYLINGFLRALTVFDARNNNVVGNVSVGLFPFAVAVNTKSNLVYVANAQSNTLSVIAGPHAHQ